MTAKERKRLKMIEYIGNPENDFPSRSELALSVLGYKHVESLYRAFTTDELTEIELRMRGTAGKRARVYDALYREAVKGNVQAAKEFLDRTEGKVKDKVEHSGGVEITHEIKLKAIKGLLAEVEGKTRGLPGRRENSGDEVIQVH